MRQINEDRRRARGSLLKRLEEFAVARHELLRQLKELDVRETVAQREYNILHNADAPTSDLPDEIMMMIFEEGMRQGHQSRHLGIIASHVSHRWREVALANPRLWTSIRFTVGDFDDPDHTRGKCAAFLSRATSSHLNIHIRQRSTQNASSDLESTSKVSALLQLVNEHMGRCRHLSVVASREFGVARMLQYISSQEMPVLTSIKLRSGTTMMTIEEPIFASGTPCLRTVDLHGLEPRSMHHCLSAFRLVTSLRLTAIFITSPELYHALRNALMALPLLIHCEIEMCYFDPGPLPCPPIAMPTLQFLRLEVVIGQQLGLIMPSIQVPSLITLSLGVRRGQEELSLPDDFLEHFPPVQHLILTNAMPYCLYYEQFARKFSGIERLTHLVTSAYVHHGSDHVLADILRDAHGGLQWPNLRTLAVSTTDQDSDASWQDVILKSRHAGHPIRRLMLPQAVIQNSAGAMMELRENMDIEAFHVNWPTPFN